MWELLGVVGAALLSNLFAGWREDNAREKNYQFNEKAAEAADTRTRNLYNDLYSAPAQMEQIKKAGLSPSLFYSGGVAGGSGQSGALSGGSNGVMPTTYGIEAQQAATIKNTNADTNLKNAEAQRAQNEADLAKKEAHGKELQNAYDEVRNLYQKADKVFDLIYLYDPETGERNTSIYEYATDAQDYDDFLDSVRKLAEKSRKFDENSELFSQLMSTEYGQKKLRTVYLQSRRFKTEISQLASDEINADFQYQVLSALKDSDFARLNKDAAIQYLKTNVSTSELTETQKNAWNRLLKKLEEKGGENTRDIIIVLSMMADQMASNWRMPNIKTSKE